VSSERAVYKYVLDGYTPSVRPVRNDSETVDLFVDLYINLLEDLVRSAWPFYCPFVIIVIKCKSTALKRNALKTRQF